MSLQQADTYSPIASPRKQRAGESISPWYSTITLFWPDAPLSCSWIVSCSCVPGVFPKRSPEMSGELFSEPGCPTLRESEDLHWSPGGPSPGLLPGADVSRAALPPARASGHTCSQGHCRQWECHSGEQGHCPPGSHPGVGWRMSSFLEPSPAHQMPITYLFLFGTSLLFHVQF